MSSNKVYEKYELVAPDGGWGYMILISACINIGTVNMFGNTFGMLFNDFMKTIEMGSTGVTVLLGINALFSALSGFLTHSLLKIMSQRKLAMFSALALNAGFIGTIFAQSYATFVICQGVLPGVSFGITYNLSCSVMNEYFDKKRVFAYSVVQSVIATLSIVAPLFVEWSLERYGYRGTLILIAGITLHNIIAVLLMQPVKWHMKQVPVTAKEMKPLLKEEHRTVMIKVTDASNNTKTEIEKHYFKIEDEKSSNIRKLIKTLVDIKFFKKFVITGACLGTSIAISAEAIYGMILPQALFADGWNQDMVAKALSLYGFGDLAMRTVMMFTSQWVLRLGSQETYLIGLAMATFAKIGMTWSKGTLLRYTFTVIMGLARTFIFVLAILVISDTVPQEQFTQAMGISMMASGVIMLMLGLAIGATRDLTNSYSTAFYLLTSFFVITIIFWVIELIYKKNKDKRDAQRKKKKSNRSIKGK